MGSTMRLAPAAAYRLAVVAVEKARADVVEEVQLGVWLNMFPETGGQVQTHRLPGDPETPLEGPPFPEILAALLRDSEQLPLRGPRYGLRGSSCTGRTASSSSSSASTKTGAFTRRCLKATRMRAGLSETC